VVKISADYYNLGTEKTMQIGLKALFAIMASIALISLANCCLLRSKLKHSKAAIQLFFRNSECDLPIDY
jgi:hypothetical protein